MNMKRGPKSGKIGTLLVVLPLFLCALSAFFFVMLRQSAYRAESALLGAASEKVASQISTVLQDLLDMGDALKSAFSENEGKNYAALKTIADNNLKKSPYIDSITIAPGAIVRYVFPEDRASESIGHDLLDNPERMQALVRAVSDRKAVVQGPSLSAEGSELAFLRIPVFRGDTLWGFVSIAFDIGRMAEALRMKDEFPDMRIALVADSREPGKTDAAHGQVFWGDEKALFGYSRTIRLGDERSGWIVRAASLYPAKRVMWWGLALVILNFLGALVLFATGIVVRQRKNGESKPLRKGFEVTPFVDSHREERKLEEQPAREKSEVPEEPAPAQKPNHDGDVPDDGASQETEKKIAPEGEERDTKASSQEAAQDAPVTAQNSGKHISVLVVDDSEVNRDLLVRMLTLKGYAVRSVSDAEQALNAIEERSFDVALIDCVMPGMDGYALAGAIKNMIDKTKTASMIGGLFGKSAGFVLKTPAMIAMSPSHAPEEADRCRKIGFDSLLVKPFTMTSLDQKIRETLMSFEERTSGENR